MILALAADWLFWWSDALDVVCRMSRPGVVREVSRVGSNTLNTWGEKLLDARG